MILGVFLAIGESIRDFKNKGQDKLLINYNFKTYSENFDKVYVFSYENERYTFFSNVIVLPNKYKLPRYFYSIFLPLFYPKEIISGDIFRGLQITGGLPGIITKLFFRKKIIINYGYDYAKQAFIEGKKTRAFLYQLLKKLIFLIADKVIVTTTELRRQLNKNNPKTVLIPNGININLFKKINQSKKYSCIFVGRLERQKNLAVLIKAASKLDKRYRTILIIGEGKLKNRLFSYARKLAVNLKVISTVSNNQLPKYYNRAEIFILPSLLEGNPKALLEAMSCGLPCIGNDISGINSIIKDKYNGLIFKKTVNSLTDKLNLLLSDPKLAIKIGVNARKTIIRNYNYEILKKKEIKLLKSAL